MIPKILYCLLLSLQDVPFLILAGIYTSRIGLLTPPSFFSLCVSLLGIGSYLLYLLRERSKILGHFVCLRNTFRKTSKFDLQGGVAGGGAEHPPPAGRGGGGQRGTRQRLANGQAISMNGRAMNGRYLGSGSEVSESDSQGTTQPVEDWMYNSSGGVGGLGGTGGGGGGGGPTGGGMDNRLSVIPEGMEAGLPPPLSHQHTEGGGGSSSSAPSPGGVVGRGGGGGGGGGGRVTVPIYMHPQDSDSEVRVGRGLHSVLICKYAMLYVRDIQLTFDFWQNTSILGLLAFQQSHNNISALSEKGSF